MAPRDPADLYKDKIEVSLDGRQIFYLFFGGAVIVGLVFVLGVMVGRRVEARGHVDQARTTAAVDPLAALDRLEGPGGLSFQGALTGAEPRSDVERKIGELEKARKGKLENKPEPKAEPKHDDKKVADKKPEPDKIDKADKADKKKPEVDKKPEPDKIDKADKKKAEDKPEPIADKKKAEDKPEAVADKKKPEDRPDPDKKQKPDGAAVEPKARFTLQLSSFQDKHEAEAFLASIKAAGYQPTLTEAEVTGKGTFYRVRLGTYRSIDAANDAKSELERTTKKTATVMRL